MGEKGFFFFSPHYGCVCGAHYYSSYSPFSLQGGGVYVAEIFTTTCFPFYNGDRTEYLIRLTLKGVGTCIVLVLKKYPALLPGI